MKADFPPLLPAGIHQMEWGTMRALCATNPARALLADNLAGFAAVLRACEVHGLLWLDGSFVTDKPEPSDIDIAVLPDAACMIAASAHAATLQELLAEPRRAVTLYHCDAYWIEPGNMHNRAYWRGLFGFAHDEATPKGIIELPL